MPRKGSADVEYGVLESAPVEREPDSKKYRKSRVAYWIMTLLGAGLLLPWNAIVSVVDYFGDIYPGFAIEFYLGMCYIYPQLPVLALMVKWGDRVSFTVRIACCFIVMAIALALLPVQAELLDSLTSRYVTLGIVFVSGLATAVLQSSIFGFASQFPPTYNQAIMAGQGVAGVGACVMRILTKIVLTDVTVSAMVYFFMSSAILVACTFAYFWLLRLPFTRYHLERSRGAPSPGRDSPVEDDSGVESDAGAAGSDARRRKDRSARKRRRAKQRSAESAESSPLLANEAPAPSRAASASPPPEPLPLDFQVSGVSGVSALDGMPPASTHLSRLASDGTSASSVASADGSTVMAPPPLESRMTLRWYADKQGGLRVTTPMPEIGGDDSASSDEDSVADETTCENYTGIVRKIWPYALVEVLIFVMTFSVFPGEISQIPYQGTVHGMSVLGQGWWPIVLITCFNCFDLTGRSLAGMATIWTRKTILIPALFRYGLIPLFVICAYHGGGFFSDIFTLVMVAVFAITNGHVASVGMMHAPSNVAPHDRERAGFMMSLFLQLGIFIGSQTALIVKEFH
uniref:Uncharacterized protein n=1 Tax=Bicosoecida sp. CB-2014 TaxID=1486930 RepID=A0A7S1C545_9STRA|mmetsp:Transcript_14023/g.48849  ORF Transcript_14023/g.48849 Transcript_14023/m.48849 type:complete len:572 (+) Transcript_14023:138-1853(+)